MERAIVTVERIQLMQIGRIGAASCNTPEIILVKVTDFVRLFLRVSPCATQ